MNMQVFVNSIFWLVQGSQPAVENGDDLSDDWAPELLICAGGFAAALLGTRCGLSWFVSHTVVPDTALVAAFVHACSAVHKLHCSEEQYNTVCMSLCISHGTMPMNDSDFMSSQQQHRHCNVTWYLLSAVVLLGMYQYSTSRAGKQAQQCLATKASTSFWLCGSNSLRQPLIPKHATAEEAC